VVKGQGEWAAGLELVARVCVLIVEMRVKDAFDDALEATTIISG
jgi:hypothetical protein